MAQADETVESVYFIMENPLLRLDNFEDLVDRFWGRRRRDRTEKLTLLATHDLMQAIHRVSAVIH